MRRCLRFLIVHECVQSCVGHPKKVQQSAFCTKATTTAKRKSHFSPETILFVSILYIVLQVKMMMSKPRPEEEAAASSTTSADSKPKAPVDKIQELEQRLQQIGGLGTTNDDPPPPIEVAEQQQQQKPPPAFSAPPVAAAAPAVGGGSGKTALLVCIKNLR